MSDRGKGGRGGNRTTGGRESSKNICPRPRDALDNHVFDYGPKGAADQVNTTLETIVQYVGTVYGNGNMTELNVVGPSLSHLHNSSNKSLMSMPRTKGIEGRNTKNSMDLNTN